MRRRALPPDYSKPLRIPDTFLGIHKPSETTHNSGQHLDIHGAATQTDSEAEIQCLDHTDASPRPRLRQTHSRILEPQAHHLLQAEGNTRKNQHSLMFKIFQISQRERRNTGFWQKELFVRFLWVRQSFQMRFDDLPG